MSFETGTASATLHTFPHPRMPHLWVGFVTLPGDSVPRVRVFTDCDDDSDAVEAAAERESLIG